MPGFIGAKSSDWRLGLFAFTIAVGYVPWTSGGATVPRWALIALTPLFLCGKARWTAAHWVGLGLIVYSFASIAWSDNIADSVGFLCQFVLLGLAFSLGTRLQNLAPAALGFGLGLQFCGAATLYQHFIDQRLFPSSMTINSGLFINCDIAAEVSALVFVWLICERLWWLLPGLLPMLIWGQSRTAWAMIAGAAIVWVWKRDRIVACCVCIMILSGIFALFATGFKGGSEINERFGIWRDTFAGITWFGHGIGSFQTAFPYYADHFDTMMRHADYAHSDILQTVFELGIGSVFLFAFLGLCLTGQDETAKLVFIAFCLCLLGDFPLRTPMAPFIGALVAGRLCQSVPDLRDVFVSCRNHLSDQLFGARRNEGGNTRIRGRGIVPV